MRRATNPNKRPIPVPEPFKDSVIYVVAIAWAEGYGGTRSFDNRGDAMLYARSHIAMGYGKPHNPIRVWKEHRELVFEVLAPAVPTSPEATQPGASAEQSDAQHPKPAQVEGKSVREEL